MRILRPTLAALAVAVALPACDFLGVQERTPNERVVELFHTEPLGPHWVGIDVEIDVIALDVFRARVPGVSVVFTLRRNDVDVHSETVVTDEEGEAGVTFAPNAAGDWSYSARVPGRQVEIRRTFVVNAVPTVAFETASVNLTAVGDDVAVFARVMDSQGNVIPGAAVTFSAAPAGVVTFHPAINPPTEESGMRARVRRAAAGDATVTATHVTGATGTLLVTGG